MLAEIIFVVFLMSILVQLGYMLGIFSNFFSLSATQPIKTASVPVSVIICAKNEGENLRQHLPQILAQRYTNAAGNPLFEVIVVDDASDDDTQQVLEELQKQHPILRVVRVAKDEERNMPGKKYALSKGVAAAENEALLMTDADCAPLSADWVSYMVQPIIVEQKHIVLGYGKYRPAKGWLNTFIRWETLHTFIQYSTYARVGIPYMGVGRNIACRKSVLLQAQQSPKWVKTASGDDDLLVQLMGNANNVKVVYEQDAHTISDAKENYQGWKRQKQRHFSTGKLYTGKTKFFLSLYALAHAASWLFFIILLFTPYRNIAYVVMGARCVTYWVLWSKAADKLGEEVLMNNIIPTDFGWALYNFVFAPYIIWKNKSTWK